jgi:hypothetical protein
VQEGYASDFAGSHTGRIRGVMLDSLACFIRRALAIRGSHFINSTLRRNIPRVAGPKRDNRSQDVTKGVSLIADESSREVAHLDSRPKPRLPKLNAPQQRPHALIHEKGPPNIEIPQYWIGLTGGKNPVPQPPLSCTILIVMQNPGNRPNPRDCRDHMDCTEST